MGAYFKTILRYDTIISNNKYGHKYGYIYLNIPLKSRFYALFFDFTRFFRFSSPCSRSTWKLLHTSFSVNWNYWEKSANLSQFSVINVNIAQWWRFCQKSLVLKHSLKLVKMTESIGTSYDLTRKLCIYDILDFLNWPASISRVLFDI